MPKDTSWIEDRFFRCTTYIKKCPKCHANTCSYLERSEWCLRRTCGYRKSVQNTKL